MFWKQFLFKKIRIEEAIVYVSFFSLTALAIIIPSIFQGTSQQSYFKYCLSLFVHPFLALMPSIIGALIIFLMIQCVVFSTLSFLKNRNPLVFFSREFLNHLLQKLFKGFKESIWLGLPVILTLFAVAHIMTYLNSSNVGRLIDEKAAAWDRAITGGYPFLYLQNISYPEWLVGVVKFSFGNLPALLFLFGFYIFLYHRQLFREFASVFCLSLVFLIAGWQFFPVLSPQDRFIDNVYNLPNPPDFVSASVSLYAPQASIISFLHEVRTDKKELDGVMPTSTLPSAHVVWALFFVYYTYRSRKIFLFATIPLAFFSTAGTVLFAQHYFVDIPSAILLAAFSIFLIRYLKKTDPSAK